MHRWDARQRHEAQFHTAKDRQRTSHARSAGSAKTTSPAAAEDPHQTEREPRRGSPKVRPDPDAEMRCIHAKYSKMNVSVGIQSRSFEATRQWSPHPCLKPTTALLSVVQDSSRHATVIDVTEFCRFANDYGFLCPGSTPSPTHCPAPRPTFAQRADSTFQVSSQ